MGNKNRISLYLEWFLLLLFAATASLLFFLAAKFVIEKRIDRYQEDHKLIQSYNKKYILKLQNYITKYQISLKDLQKLDDWIDDNRLVYLQIKKDGKWIYFSDFHIDETQQSDYDFLPYSSENYYELKFNDGIAQAFIMGMYSYNAYMIAMITDMAISFLLFLILTMFGIRRKIIYINQLSRDIEILEGGNLEYNIHMQGNDEITDLARGLNNMKNSFKTQIKEIECLTRTNKKMVTEISHDLRTPLTSVLLYAEILHNGKYTDEEQKQKYLDKIVKKIQHMKGLSDTLLEYSVHNSEEKYIPPVYNLSHTALYDELSDMCHYLEEQGFKIKPDLNWKKGNIFIYEEYLIRILDNISSNILKYADSREFILIWNNYYKDEMCITFENTCINKNNNTDSYSIGLKNIKMMIEEMGGRCEIVQNQEKFQICLTFRYIGQ